LKLQNFAHYGKPLAAKYLGFSNCCDQIVNESDVFHDGLHTRMLSLCQETPLPPTNSGEYGTNENSNNLLVGGGTGVVTETTLN
jgi:hypothetical protein